VVCEQGVGDVIQFARYLPWAKTRCKRLIFSVYRDIMPLFVGYPGVDELRPIGWDVPEPEDALRSTRLLDLPHWHGTTTDNVPADPGHLARFSKRFRGTLSCGDGQIKVGLVWAGNPDHTKDYDRSMPFKSIARLAQNPLLQLYSFQVGPRSHDIADGGYSALVTDLSGQLTSYSVTVTALKDLDLLVTVDTSVAHIAGCLGIPTFLLICKLPDWRWLLGRNDTPWYPSVKLFRQKTLGDWDGLMKEVYDAVDNFANRMLSRKAS
jgi:hypothetical protein